MLPVPLWEGLPSVMAATVTGLGDVSPRPWQALLSALAMQLKREASAEPSSTRYAEPRSAVAIVSIARAKLLQGEALSY